MRWQRGSDCSVVNVNNPVAGLLYLLLVLPLCLSAESPGQRPAGSVLSTRSADSTSAIYLSPENLKDGIWASGGVWKYHPGDSADWATPDLDDRSWVTADPRLFATDSVSDGWEEVGWFRLRVIVDQALIDEPLGLWLWQAGRSQVYLDGTLIPTIGGTDQNRAGLARPFILDGTTQHIIAIRYTNESLTSFHEAGFPAGFFLQFGRLDAMVDAKVLKDISATAYQMFFTSLPLAIGLLHLILFAFFPRLRQNIYFALFLFFYAAAIFSDYQASLATDMEQQLYWLRIHVALNPFWVLFQLGFIYSLFSPKLPKQIWAIAAVTAAMGVLSVFRPVEMLDLFGIAYLVASFEIIRVIVTALIRKKDSAWIIAVSYGVFMLFGAIDTLYDKGVDIPFMEMENPYAFGVIGFVVGMSVFLSRDIARTNKELVEQRTEQKLLEAENARQTEELEQARQLQMSMLPKELPESEQFEIAVFMKTATEVGGDYYDFKQHDDGTLTLVIGDATGHGMQAGIMVSAMKSLFNALADDPEPIRFLEKGTDAIKAMGLKKMFMALTIAKIRGRSMTIAAAGMPFPLVYRGASGHAEEVVLKGMPLGGPSGFPYMERTIQLAAGDTVLFMSDGFPEMHDPQSTLLGEERVKELFQKVGLHSPSAIIELLKEAGEAWGNGRSQEDDVTFVVLKAS